MVFKKKALYLHHNNEATGRVPGIKNDLVMKAAKISISNFKFELAGYGHYSVSFQSPTTGRIWKTTTSDTSLIDATKNADFPKLKDLEDLKRLCKNG